MFDEQSPTQPQSQSQPQPQKQEPQDIFSEVPTMQASQTSHTPPPGDMQSPYPQEQHSGFNPKLILIVVAILAVLVIAAFGVQFALRSQQSAQQPQGNKQVVQQQPLPPPEQPSEPQTPPPGLVSESQGEPPITPVDQLTAPVPASGTGLPTAEQLPSVPAQNASDTDSDGLLNDEELQIGTDPSKADSDDDTVSDGEEVKTYKTNPLLADSDSDGLDDAKELKTYKSDPLNSDTDGDGYLDGAEVNNGYNPSGPGKLTPETK